MKIGNPTISRRISASVLVAISILLIGVGVSGTGLFLILLTTAALYSVALAPDADLHSHDRLSASSLLPAGAVASIFSATCIGFLTSFSGNPYSRVSAQILWLIVMAIPLTISWKRSGIVAMWKGDGIAVISTALIAGVGVAISLIYPLYSWAAAVGGSGTDFNRHLVFVRQIVLEGGLSYDAIDYPRAVHTYVALGWSASGGENYSDAWQALEATTWFLLVLMLLAILVVSIRTLRFLGGRSIFLEITSAIIATMVFIQSMWFTSFFRLGFVTSITAGLVTVSVIALAIDNKGSWFGSLSSLAWLSVSVAVLLNTWTLVAPVVLIAAMISLWLVMRNKAVSAANHQEIWLSFIIILISVAVSIPPIYGLLVIGRSSDGEFVSDLNTVGQSGLALPQMPWAICIVLTIIYSVWLFRLRYRRFIALFLVVLLTGLGITLVIVFLTARPNGISYYASKMLWTSLVLTISPTAAVASAIVANAFRWSKRQTSDWRRIGALTLVLSIMTIFVAGVFGRMSSTPSGFLAWIRGESVGIPVQLAVVTQLEKLAIVDGQYEQALVWGLIPEANVESMQNGRVGLYDMLARESTGWFGLVNFLADVQIQSSIAGRNSDSACAFLRDFPNALRITGPNPAAGPEWLLSAGCPESVVKPADWVVIPLEDWGYSAPVKDGGDIVYEYPKLQEFLDSKGNSLDTEVKSDFDTFMAPTS